MTARPRIDSPTARESLAFVAAASIPGSIEARLIHGCVCSVARQHARIWRPELVEHWQGVICLSCPAHGRLLERYVQNAQTAQGQGQRQRRLNELMRQTQAADELRRRSLFVRMGAWIRDLLVW
jgi:hypothetical protein